MTNALALTRRTLLVAPLALAACRRGADILEFTGLTMGTDYSIVVVDHDRKMSRPALQQAIDGALAQVNAEMSNWDVNSEISQVNRASGAMPLSVSDDLYEVLSAAQNVHLASDGQFDVTLGPLIELWGFGASPISRHTPTDADIAQAMQTVGQGKSLTLGNGAVQKAFSSTEIYLSAIGKGFGVDKVARALESAGAVDYLVEIGGDLYTAGRNPVGLPWQIGIESPNARAQSVQQVISVSGLGMATSGDYRNYFEVDGQRFSHMLDAHTGRPITHTTASATVLTENAMFADAWATAMLILGRERGMQIAEEQNLAVLFIERDPNASDMQFIETPSSRYTRLQA
ncbi:MAG: FAD:protein FMN transferase [Pseudomonadota bacterium]